MERTLISFIFGSFLIAFLLLVGLIIGLEKTVHYLQHRTIEANFDQNISILKTYIEHGDHHNLFVDVDSLLNYASTLSKEEYFDQKRKAVSRGALLTAEHFLDMATNNSRDGVLRQEWILNGCNSYKIAALHQFASIEPYQREMITKLNRMYKRDPGNSYEMTKLSNELLFIMTSEIPRLIDRSLKYEGI